MQVQFNTDAKYTREGQVIRADLQQDESVLFRDFSRMIWGRIPAAPFGLSTKSELQRYVTNEYLHCNYEYDGEAGQLTRLD